MPAVPDASPKEEDDLDDLDDVLDEFNKPQEAASAPAPASASADSSSSAAPAASGSGVHATTVADDDEDAVGEEDDDLLSQQFAKELAEGMEQLMKELTGGAGLPGAAGLPEGEGVPAATGETGEPPLNEEEMMKQFEEMMATMGLGGPTGDSAAASGSSAAASGSRSSGPAAPPANYQEALKATMSRLRESDTNASASASGGQDEIAKLLSALGGMGGMEGLGDLGGLADSPDMANMLESVMGELMSKSLLYEPMKELAEKYPAFIENPPRALSSEDRARYTKQAAIVANIVQAFDDPKYDSGSESEKARLKELVQTNMNEMQECGAPPDEIVGKMPPGLDGMPGLGPNANPEDCTIM